MSVNFVNFFFGKDSPGLFPPTVRSYKSDLLTEQIKVKIEQEAIKRKEEIKYAIEYWIKDAEKAYVDKNWAQVEESLDKAVTIIVENPSVQVNLAGNWSVFNRLMSKYRFRSMISKPTNYIQWL